MNNFARFSYIACLGIVALQISVACDKHGSSTPQIGQPPSSGGSSTSAQGTSDSGGCNGVDGKCYDSYIVDPTKIDGYTQYVAKVLGNIKTKTVAGDVSPSFDYFFKSKTWYILPAHLEPIDKEVLGVTELGSDTQQIARQSMREIWIDQEIFNKMSVHDQGVTILHEFIMSLYIFKFSSVSEICARSQGLEAKAWFDCSDKRAIELLDSLKPPEKQAPLSKQDYENIRYVTGWLEQREQKPQEILDFYRVLFANGFDKRMFNPVNYADGSGGLPPDLKLTHKQIFEAINGAALSGNMPDVCTGGSNGVTQACQVAVHDLTLNLGPGNVLGLSIKVDTASNSPISFLDMTFDQVSLFPEPDEDGQILYGFVVNEWRPQPFKVGDRVYSGFFIFSKDSDASQTGLTLRSITLRPGVIVSIDTKRDVVCQLQEPKVMNLFDDQIVITRDGHSIGPIERTFSATPPLAGCASTNVKE